MNALISGVFPHMAARSGAYPFIFFCLMMMVQFSVVLMVYPETKGVTLEDMQKHMEASRVLAHRGSERISGYLTGLHG